MLLIIAEKPSLGRNIAAAIEQIPGNSQMSKKNGYLEGNGYIISWAFGHLFSLSDIEYYNPRPDGAPGWCMDNLPCFPDKFHFELRKGADKKVDSGVEKQFMTIRYLCERKDVDTIVNAGDADREGEIIIRICVENACRLQKPFKRLWLPDQTPQTVQAALADLKDETEYTGLADEGYARTYIDWLYGVNLTRYATLKTGVLLRVGRVIVPIVKAIYDRDIAIRNFVSGKYFAIISKEKTNGEEVELISKQKFNPDEYNKAQELCARYNAADAVVADVKLKKETLFPGKLYSLSKLQNVLGKKYKMSMAESLEIVQKLYEAGYLTYPRTNSEYLATAEKDKVKKIISIIAKIGYPVQFRDSKKIFDDSKIESHSALTPTYKIPGKDALNEKERQVYSTVFRRFVAVFCAEDCIVNRTEITIDVGGYEEFVLKGTVMVEKGWTKYDDSSMKDKVLPKLEKGDLVNHIFKPTEKETVPPKHYTIETLNNYLKNPFREEKAADDAEASAVADSIGANDAQEYRDMLEGVELGTEATRTGIIDNARKSKYIALNKDVYTILKDGEYLIESLERMNISMDKYKTCQMGRALKQVFRGQLSIDGSVALAREEIAAVFQNAAGDADHDRNTGMYGEVIGKCPLCGNDVKRGRYSYGCSGFREGCKLSIGISICGKTVPISVARQLLTSGKSELLDGFVSKKSGRSFDAYLKLDGEKAVFEFPERGKSAPIQTQSSLPPADGESYPIPEEPPF